MGLFDVVDIFTSLSLLGQKDAEKKRPRIFILFYILFILGLFGLFIELNPIFNLLTPIWFIGLFTIIGLLLTLGTVILIWKLNLIEQINRKDFFAILIPITLLTISGASFINRSYGKTNNFQTVVVNDPQHGTNISKAVVILDGEDIWTRVPRTTDSSLKKGDLLEIRKTKGLLGFDIISGTTILKK
jgi:hypothetical protein